MVDHAIPGAGEFEAMARQYWNLWGDALRQMGGAPPHAPGWQHAPGGWQQALDWWSRLMPNGTPGGDALLGRFRQQSGDWFGLMQQVAARFAGQDATPSDIGQAWRHALGADAAQGPWRDLFRTLQGGGQGGFDGWYQQITPWLETLQRENARWLHAPTFGLAREHQERWQALALAQQEYQRSFADYEQLMLRVAQLAFDRFQDLLEQRSQPGQQITSARGLFDLWIDAAEHAYGEVALSPDFRHVYGALTNAQMRLRVGVQREIEQVCIALGMPARTEVDSAHRKIAELERRLRRMERAQASAPVAASSTKHAAAAKAPNSAQKKTRPARERDLAPEVVAAPVPPVAPTPAPARAKDSRGKKKKARDKSSVGKKASRASASAPASVKRAPAPAKAKPAKKNDRAAVVSMKDWVARYANESARKSTRGEKAE